MVKDVAEVEKLLSKGFFFSFQDGFKSAGSCVSSNCFKSRKKAVLPPPEIFGMDIIKKIKLI